MDELAMLVTKIQTHSRLGTPAKNADPIMEGARPPTCTVCFYCCGT